MVQIFIFGMICFCNYFQCSTSTDTTSQVCHWLWKLEPLIKRQSHSIRYTDHLWAHSCGRAMFLCISNSHITKIISVDFHSHCAGEQPGIPFVWNVRNQFPDVSSSNNWCYGCWIPCQSILLYLTATNTRLILGISTWFSHSLSGIQAARVPSFPRKCIISTVIRRTCAVSPYYDSRA